MKHKRPRNLAAHAMRTSKLFSNKAVPSKKEKTARKIRRCNAFKLDIE